MTKENAAQYLPLVQALADGKEIQVRALDRWLNATHDLKFDRPADEYRIKPAPREFDMWITVFHDGEICSATNSDMSAHGPDWRKIRVREVEGGAE